MRYLLQIVLLTLVSVYAWRRAGATEIGGAAIMAVLLLASPVYAALYPQAGKLEDLDLGYFLIDGIVLMAMVGLALVSEKWWPLWLAGAQLIAALSHFVKLLDADYAPFAYALMMRSPSWIQLVILVCATCLEARQRQPTTDDRHQLADRQTL